MFFFLGNFSLKTQIHVFHFDCYLSLFSKSRAVFLIFLVCFYGANLALNSQDCPCGMLLSFCICLIFFLLIKLRLHPN